MKVLFKFLAVFSIVFSSTAFAHIDLVNTLPADNAMFMETPEKLTLTFSNEVRIIKITLKSKDGGDVKFGFKPSKETRKMFSWTLPELTPANYIVDVIFLGKDGHKMKESFGFMVH